MTRTVEVFDTTLRDGLQVGGRQRHRRGQAAHRRAARPPRRALHRGWLAGRQPEGHRVLRPRRHVSSTSRRAHSSPSARPGARVARSTTTRRCATSSTPAPRRCASSPRARSTTCRGTADDARRGRGDDRRLGRVPRRARPAGARRHRALLRRVQGATPSSRCAPSRRPSSRAPATSCCATPTVARCPHEVGEIVADVHGHFGDDVTIGIHCHDDTGCAVANSMAAVAAGATPRAGHAQRPRRAHRQRQPHHGHPQPPAQAGLHLPPRGTHRAAHSGQPPRRRAAQPGRQPAGAVRRLVGVRPQGRTARQRDRPRQGRLRARRSGAGGQRHPLRRQRDGRAGDDHDEGGRARPGDGRPGGQHR